MIRRKRCEFCEALFRPDRRVKNRQRACGKGECKRERARQASRDWKRRNRPGPRPVIAAHETDNCVPASEVPEGESRHSGHESLAQVPSDKEVGFEQLLEDEIGHEIQTIELSAKRLASIIGIRDRTREIDASPWSLAI